MDIQFHPILCIWEKQSSKMNGNMIENPFSPLLHLLKSTCKILGNNKFWN